MEQFPDLLIWDKALGVNTTVLEVFGSSETADNNYDISPKVKRDYYTCMQGANMVKNCQLPGRAGTATAVIGVIMVAMCHRMYGI